MDQNAAFAVLGVEPSASLAEAQTAYRTRARLLHPDRVAEPDRPAASRAMAQLNDAWEVVQKTCGATAAPSRAPLDDAQPLLARLPRAGECDLCGWAPAEVITLRRITGLLIVWRAFRGSYQLCRGCGDGMYAAVQSTTLIRGWWGVLPVLANLITLLRNRSAITKHRFAVGPPQTRDPAVATQFQKSQPYRSPWRRPGPIIATLIAATLVAAVVDDAYHNAHPTPVTYTLPTGVGDCVTASGQTVACTATNAAYKLVQLVTATDQCDPDNGSTATFTQDTTGLIFCAAPVP
jgi:hypothetical protein